MFKSFGAFHIISILFFIGMTVGLYFLLRKRTLKTKRLVIIIILLSNLFLHFVKMFFFPYNTDFHGQFHKMTLENICSITTVVAPFFFIFLKKESPIHDFFYFIMFIGGFLGLIIPTEANNKDMSIYMFDILRYFYCHGFMFVCALLIQLLGIHRVNIRNIWIVPVGLIVYETIIFLNELILFNVGMLSITTYEEFFDSNSNNNSFTFGVTPDMEEVKPFLYCFTPSFMRYMKNGYESCLPVVWLIIPLSIYTPPLMLLISWPFYLLKRKQ